MHINCLVNSSDNPSEEAETMSQSQLLSYVQLFETPRTIACQGPLSMGFSWQEYWSGLLFPPPEIFPTQGLNTYLLGFLHYRQILYHRAIGEALLLSTL